MDESTEAELKKNLEQFHIPRYQELPDFGLRLEQVTRYVSRYVPGPVTASMVSNYVKQKIIPGPEKKSYGVESIAYLIAVSYLKNAVSLEDVRFMLGVQQDSYPLPIAYDYFCEELEDLLRYVMGLQDAPSDLGGTVNPQKELLRTALLSITYRIYLNYRIELLRGADAASSPEPKISIG